MAVFSRLCVGEDGDGCGRLFPHKTSSGMCAKCQKLSGLAPGSIDFELWRSMPQCKGCGIAWKNLQSDLCGTCESKGAGSSPEQQDTSPSSSLSQISMNAVEIAKQARAQATSTHLKKSPRGDIRNLSTTAGLNYAKNGGGQPGSDKIKIAIEVRIKGTSKRSNVGDSYGKWIKSWAKDVYLTEVLEDSLAALNVTWEKEEGMSLILNEVQFRFPGNKNFHPSNQLKSVGYVYSAYILGESADFYKPKDLQSKEVKGPAVFFELFVDRPATHKRGRAPQGSSSDDDFTESISMATKRPPRKKARQGIIQETGEVEIMWPDNLDAVPVRGLLSIDVFAQGLTKRVYKLMLDGDLFVAKQFFNVGAGPDTVTVAENEKYFQAELIRLCQGSWFLNRFHDIARQRDVGIFSGLVFSEGFLLRAHPQVTDTPANPLDQPVSAVWLVEPRRTTTVIKFSGTMQHPSTNDKRGITIAAFAYFVFEFSGHKLVFADIQGSPMTVDGRDGIVLFDVMTHTDAGHSGIGDHGKEGITSFIRQHKCDYICTGMGLPPLIDTESDGESSETS
ncbi:kinase-like domain-containing protein [Phlebopus sp. FC_14]|nr:kinase-like domain-containing protein [Phlebopus sp. FC_14]